MVNVDINTSAQMEEEQDKLGFNRICLIEINYHRCKKKHGMLNRMNKVSQIHQ